MSEDNLELPRRRRALCVAIAYKDEPEKMFGPLDAAHKDVPRIKRLLREVYGYEGRHITILMDDGNHKSPTRENILHEMHKLVRGAREGDHLLFSFSGHGTQIPTDDPNEADGLDEALLPVDYEVAEDEGGNMSYENHIVDNEIHDILATHLRPGIRMTLIFDCCHSGTAADLAFTTDPSDGGALKHVHTVRNVKIRDNQVVENNVHEVHHNPRTNTADVNSALPPNSRGKGAVPKDLENYPNITSWSACQSAENAPESKNTGGLFVRVCKVGISEVDDSLQLIFFHH